MARRFRFRLDTVLKLRQQSRDRQRRVVVEALQAVRRMEERIAQLTQQVYRTIGQSRDAHLAGRLDVASLSGHEFHRNWLHRQIMESDTVLTEKRSELEVERVKLAELWKRMKAIEQLREKQWRRHRVEVAREEQIAGDEAALNLHLRQRRPTRDEVAV